jgi:hypothetical protein
MTGMREDTHSSYTFLGSQDRREADVECGDDCHYCWGPGRTNEAPRIPPAPAASNLGTGVHATAASCFARLVRFPIQPRVACKAGHGRGAALPHDCRNGGKACLTSPCPRPTPETPPMAYARGRRTTMDARRKATRRGESRRTTCQRDTGPRARLPWTAGPAFCHQSRLEIVPGALHIQFTSAQLQIA